MITDVDGGLPARPRSASEVEIRLRRARGLRARSARSPSRPTPTFLLGPTDPYVARLRDAATRAAHADLWVAVDDGDAGARQRHRPARRARLARAGSRRTRVSSGCWPWRPPAQGRGVGEALARHAIDRSRAQGAPAVVISSLPDMAAATGSTSGSASAGPRRWTGTRSRRRLLIAFRRRPGGVTGRDHADLHRRRRRHRGRGRLRRPGGARHPAAAGLVRGGHLRRHPRAAAAAPSVGTRLELEHRGPTRSGPSAEPVGQRRSQLTASTGAAVDGRP